jgi:predicted nucleotidyltransferase
MMKLPNDFKELLRIFNAHEVRYLVVGGYAVVYYGYVRATDDLDIWVANGEADIAKVRLSLNEFGFPESDIRHIDFKKPDHIVRMGVPPFRIELLTGVSGLVFEKVYQKRETIRIDGVELSLIDLENLKINKKASGRHKDLDDLENI